MSRFVHRVVAVDPRAPTRKVLGLNTGGTVELDVSLDITPAEEEDDAVGLLAAAEVATAGIVLDAAHAGSSDRDAAGDTADIASKAEVPLAAAATSAGEAATSRGDA